LKQYETNLEHLYSTKDFKQYYECDKMVWDISMCKTKQTNNFPSEINFELNFQLSQFVGWFYGGMGVDGHINVINVWARVMSSFL